MSETERTLHAIRVAELDAARRIESARAAGAEALAAARHEHSQVVAEAELLGRAEAERRLDAAIADAEREAAEILAGGDARVRSLRTAAEPSAPAAVTEMVDLLLAPPLEKGK